VILVDSSIWVDHLRSDEPGLRQLLERSLVLGHPWVTGELALGDLGQRREVLGLLARLPAATVATPEEVLGFIERHKLMGRGIGYVDVQLLASTSLSAAQLWTRDKRLATGAADLDIAVDLRTVEGR
jgi:predicted nucleic acid-binding protein